MARCAGASRCGLERLLDEVLAVARDCKASRGYARAVETVREARRRMLEDEKEGDGVPAPTALATAGTGHGR